jgi:hypothetical protein
MVAIMTVLQLPPRLSLEKNNEMRRNRKGGRETGRKGGRGRDRDREERSE